MTSMILDQDKGVTEDEGTTRIFVFFVLFSCLVFRYFMNSSIYTRKVLVNQKKCALSLTS